MCVRTEHKMVRRTRGRRGNKDVNNILRRTTKNKVQDVSRGVSGRLNKLEGENALTKYKVLGRGRGEGLPVYIGKVKSPTNRK